MNCALTVLKRGVCSTEYRIGHVSIYTLAYIYRIELNKSVLKFSFLRTRNHKSSKCMRIVANTNHLIKASMTISKYSSLHDPHTTISNEVFSNFEAFASELLK